MDFKIIAQHLACPKGDFGLKVAKGMNVLNHFISKNTYQFLEIKNKDVILEIGFGNGNFIPEILNLGNKVSYTGIEISETMLAEARRSNHQFLDTGNLDLIKADIENMPFWEGTFNKICTVNTIYFWKNPKAALDEVYRVLQKDGIFIIAFRPFIEGQSVDFSEYGFQEYTLEDVETLLKESNFELVDQHSLTEPPVEFQGQVHELVSSYIVVKK